MSTNDDFSCDSDIYSCLDLKDFDYDLDKKLIAQRPLSNRDHSRLCVVDKDYSFSDQFFYQLPKLLAKNSLLLLNDTKVFAARLFGYIKKDPLDKIKKLELLALSYPQPNKWCQCLVKPSKNIDLDSHRFFCS